MVCLIYQFVRYHKDEYSEEYPRIYYEALDQTSLAQIIECRIPIYFMVWKFMAPSKK